MTMKTCRRLACLLLLAGTLSCRGGEPPRLAEDTPAALEQAMQRIYKAAAEGKAETLNGLCRELVLPDAAAWFAKVFGEQTGAALAAEYGTHSPSMVPQAAELFHGIVAKGQETIRVDRFTDSQDGKATGLQRAALAAMRHPVALYSVRFIKPGEEYGMHVWSFVHAGGAFRLVGKLRTVQREGTP